MTQVTLREAEARQLSADGVTHSADAAQLDALVHSVPPAHRHALQAGASGGESEPGVLGVAHRLLCAQQDMSPLR